MTTQREADGVTVAVGTRHLNVAELRTDLALTPQVNLHLELPYLGRVSDVKLAHGL